MAEYDMPSTAGAEPSTHPDDTTAAALNSATSDAEALTTVRHVNVEASTVRGGDVVRHLGAWRTVRSVMTLNNAVCIALETDSIEARVVWEVAAGTSVMVRKTS